MEVALKAELRKEISRIVDLMIQGEAIRESINELKKDIKSEYDIPVATITKIATIVRKENMDEEHNKMQRQEHALAAGGQSAFALGRNCSCWLVFVDSHAPNDMGVREREPEKNITNREKRRRKREPVAGLTAQAAL